jgi:phosphoglycolate phosphatase-like HAD superfamily hydrolase
MQRNRQRRQGRLLAFLIGWLCLPVVGQSAESPPDPLPSWNAGATKSSIVDFVTRVTTEGGADFVPVPERIATFDNDGTLWCEQPDYVQAIFALDRIKSLAPDHPKWKEEAPFSAILSNDREAIKKLGEHDYAVLVGATHAGMTTEQFEEIVRKWMDSHEHPRFHRPYTSLAYQPMLELLAYLRSKQFKTFIVSGGGIDFMREFTDSVYGIPPEQVIGSSGKTKFEFLDKVPVLMKLPEIGSIDDGPGKPININLHIGRRPIMAFGNSDGDLQMLQWTSAGDKARFGLIVHHTDAEREYAYDRNSHVGHLEKALDQAPEHGWTVVDMKRDWKTIFSSAPQEK